MAPVGWQPLQSLRLNRMMRGLQDERTLPQQLVFLNRTPIVDALEGEIMARVNGYVTIADLIADDQQAVVYAADTITYEGLNVPNLKHGRALNQSMLNQLNALSQNPTQGDVDFFQNYEARQLDALLLGVRQRMESLLVGMAIDDLSYNRLGIIFSNLSWGMPSDLKVTPVNAWTVAGSATPVDDILTVVLIARTRYGQNFDRVTMSTGAFRAMIATTEFQNKARMFLAPNVSFVNLSAVDLTFMKTLAQNVLGMMIELYDSRYWVQSAAGAITNEPFLPLDKVVLSNSADDNSPAVRDFANAVVTESIVAGMVPSALIGGTMGAPSRGPVAYATAANPNLNPPGVTMWGVARGFPRKHLLQETAVLDVGTITDPIDPNAPF